MIFPFSGNWITTYKFSLFSKLPPKYKKIRKNTYQKAPLRGAFAYAYCNFAVFFVKLFGNAENNQNCNLGLIFRFWKIMLLPGKWYRNASL